MSVTGPVLRPYAKGAFAFKYTATNFERFVSKRVFGLIWDRCVFLSFVQFRPVVFVWKNKEKPYDVHGGNHTFPSSVLKVWKSVFLDVVQWQFQTISCVGVCEVYSDKFERSTLFSLRMVNMKNIQSVIRSRRKIYISTIFTSIEVFTQRRNRREPVGRIVIRNGKTTAIEAAAASFPTNWRFVLRCAWCIRCSWTPERR